MNDWDAKRSRRGHALHGALRDLRSLYRLADDAYRPFSCPATAECCRLSAVGRQPWLWPVEWALLLEASGPRLPPARDDGSCPFLDAEGKRCTVYADRPFGCRTFFCHRVRGPAREPVARVAQLAQRLERVARTLDPECTAPRPLLAWHRQARAVGAAP